MKQALPISSGMKIKWISTSEMPSGMLFSFAKMFEGKDSDQLIKNAFTELRWIQADETLIFPVTINTDAISNSFVCSPYTAYALYSRDELKHKVPNKLLQLPVLLIIKFLSLLLRWGRIDQNVHVNNFLLSTNPYPWWNGDDIEELTRFLIHHYPKHAIIFRSLNVYQHKDLIKAMEQSAYDKIASRQVYIYDLSREVWLKKNNNKNDFRLLRKQQLTYLDHEKMGNYLKDALHLYNQLYLKKYSTFNPQFTLEYFKSCHASETIHFQGYCDESGKLKAFAAVFVIEDTITSPLVGYDTVAPQKQGLYIHAIQLVMKYKFDTGKLLNLSSGAAEFKRLRGGIPAMEYSLVYTKHLPLYRRSVWKSLEWISNKVGVPIMEKYEL